jgi:hypothetical protein
MRSDQLDISIETLDNDLYITLSGPFYPEQIPGVEEKFRLLIEDGNKNYLVDLERSDFRSPDITSLFLSLLNNINGRGGRLILIFSNEKNRQFFDPYINVFEIYRDLSELKSSGFLKSLKRTGIYYSKKTGIRLSPVIALILLILISGWVMTLFSIISYQERQIHNRENILSTSESKVRELEREILNLERSLGPLKDLGLINDSLKEADFDKVSEWVEYLNKLEERRLKKNIISPEDETSED